MSLSSSGVRQRHQPALGGADDGRLLVVDPVADIFDAGRRQVLGRVQRLRQPRPQPADRPLAGEARHDGKRALDHAGLVALLVDRPLLIGVAHEFPARVLGGLRDAGVVLTDPGIGRERRPDAELRVELEEPPAADPHAVLVPGPVHHVRHQLDARRGREQLARHRLADVPDLVIDDGPEHDACVARQLERRAIDDRRKVGALARDHRTGHEGYLGVRGSRHAWIEPSDRRFAIRGQAQRNPGLLAAQGYPRLRSAQSGLLAR